MSELTKITDQNFETEVLKSDLAVLVDFWAPWCAPCQAIASVVEAVAKKFADKIKVAKLNTDENPHTPANFGIMSIPTLIFFKQGKEIERLVGYHPQPALEEKINRLLS